MKVRLKRDHRITLFKDGVYEARKQEHGGYELVLQETLTVASSEVEELTYERDGVPLIVGELYDITTRKGRLFRGRRFVDKQHSWFVFETSAGARTNVWSSDGSTVVRSALAQAPQKEGPVRE